MRLRNNQAHTFDANDISFSRYLSTFSPSTTDDAERDEVLTQKIRIFRWIKPEHLDIPDNAHNAAYLDKAQAGTFLSVTFRCR